MKIFIHPNVSNLDLVGTSDVPEYSDSTSTPAIPDGPAATHYQTPTTNHAPSGSGRYNHHHQPVPYSLSSVRLPMLSPSNAPENIRARATRHQAPNINHAPTGLGQYDNRRNHHQPVSLNQPQPGSSPMVDIEHGPSLDLCSATNTLHAPTTHHQVHAPVVPPRAPILFSSDVLRVENSYNVLENGFSSTPTTTSTSGVSEDQERNCEGVCDIVDMETEDKQEDHILHTMTTVTSVPPSTLDPNQDILQDFRLLNTNNQDDNDNDKLFPENQGHNISDTDEQMWALINYYN